MKRWKTKRKRRKIKRRKRKRRWKSLKRVHMVVITSSNINSHHVLHHTPSYTLATHPRMERPYQIQEYPHKKHHLI
jgi:hypothetical protein